MQWFKFYGQDFLTDPKMRLLTLEEKMCWIILLCLANAEDRDGEINFISPTEVMHQASIEFDTPMWENTRGFIPRFEALRLLQISNVHSNAGSNTKHNEVHYDVILTNFFKRQNENLTGAERQKRHREKLKQAKKQSNTKSNNSNTEQRHNSNAREEKNRIDNKRVSKDTLCEPSSQKEKAVSVKGKKKESIKLAEPAAEQPKFEGKPYIEGMLKDQQKHVRIIALFLMAKKIVPENEKQMATQIKRNLRAASDLSGYEGEKIKRTMIFLRDFGPKMRLTKWTLETVGKYIDEDLEQMKKTIEEKNNSKIQKVWGENIKI